MGRRGPGRVFLLALVLLLALQLQTPAAADKKATPCSIPCSSIDMRACSVKSSLSRSLTCIGSFSFLSFCARLQPCVIFFQDFPASPFALLSTITNE